ncbi:ParA family protein [Mycobacterium marinum]|uniref:ParA family protein n=1 Tax=Mycobacterium marinum TaxID=1781 RepID=UPI000B965696|nr:AAA family ATPase [Mycobacterium marinum]
MKIVSFFNHKGGVGKTTLIFNVGLALAQSGSKVLFVDADAQTNLTSTALDAERYEGIIDGGTTIYSSLLPVIRGTGDVELVTPVQIRENAWIIPGDIRLSDFEEVLPAAWTDSMSGRYQGFQRSTAIHSLIQSLGAQISADFAFVDLGPSVGALNRVALLGSDGFVVPLAPDLFSLTALPSVGRSLNNWISEWDVALGQAARTGVDQDFRDVLLPGKPSPLGYISQQFASYRSAPTAAFQRWLDQIPSTYDREIADRLASLGAHIPRPPAEIGTVRNLSSLVPMAQEANAAIFELSGSEARGAQYTRARDTLADFLQLGQSIVERLSEVE